MNRSLRLHFIARYRRWQLRRTMQRHALATGRALALVAETNPTLAAVTWKRIDERTAQSVRTREALADYVEDVSALVVEAVRTEQRRQEMR